MIRFKVTTKEGSVFIVEAWNESKVIWLMSYEGYEVLTITEI
jgi:hypothetical protein